MGLLLVIVWTAIIRQKQTKRKGKGKIKIKICYNTEEMKQVKQQIWNVM